MTRNDVVGDLLHLDVSEIIGVHLHFKSRSKENYLHPKGSGSYSIWFWIDTTSVYTIINVPQFISSYLVKQDYAPQYYL